MLKQLGIAAACGIALYGVARYIKNNHVVVIDASGDFPDLFAAGTNAHEAAEAGTEVPREGDDLVTMPRAPADAAVAEVASTDPGQGQSPGEAPQAAS